MMKIFHDKNKKTGPTPSAYSAHVFEGKYANTLSRIYIIIYCSDWGGLDPILTPLNLFVLNEIYMAGSSI